MSQHHSDQKSTLAEVMAWCCKAISNYLSQWCPAPNPKDCSVMSWHYIDTKWMTKMSTMQKFHPINADDTVLTSCLGNWCIQTFHWMRLFQHVAVVGNNFVHCDITVDTFLHQCFLGITHWFRSKLDTFWLNSFVYLYHLTQVPHIY